MKTKCVVFGAGQLFQTYIFCIEKKYDVLAVADNSKKKQGQYINKYRIISPDEISEYPYDTILICSSYAKEIQMQLLEMGIEEISLFVIPGLLCDYGLRETGKEKRFFEAPYRKKNRNLHILFVQIFPCSRTVRFAEILHNRGIDCSLAYFGVFGKEKKKATMIFDQIVPFFSYGDFVDYVKNSEYDLIHCSNEPDILTNLLIGIGKPIVHDCHDFLTLRENLTAETMALEFIANCRSDGCIYPSSQCLQIAIDRYGRNEKTAIYMENYPPRDALPKRQLKKLSSIDNKIHCVYEGAITDNPNSYRFFEEQWSILASIGIHVHFYTQFREEYCRQLDSSSEYIHYEGNVAIYDLLTLMTQYDVGLCTYRELTHNKIKLDTASPNKLYEYLASGLPIALSNHSYYKDLMDKYTIGRVIDWNGDIKTQISDVSKMSIPHDFIIDNGFTMEDEANKLISFYKKVIADYNG